MAKLLSYTAVLGLKLLVLSGVTSLLSWYFIVNPSFPDGIGILVALASVFGLAYMILSSVDSMVQAEYQIE